MKASSVKWSPSRCSRYSNLILAIRLFGFSGYVHFGYDLSKDPINNQDANDNTDAEYY